VINRQVDSRERLLPGRGDVVPVFADQGWLNPSAYSPRTNAVTPFVRSSARVDWCLPALLVAGLRTITQAGADAGERPNRFPRFVRPLGLATQRGRLSGFFRESHPSLAGAGHDRYVLDGSPTRDTVLGWSEPCFQGEDPEGDPQRQRDQRRPEPRLQSVVEEGTTDHITQPEPHPF